MTKFERVAVFYLRQYNTTVIQTSWHWHKDKYLGHWNRIKNPKIDSHI